MVLSPLALVQYLCFRFDEPGTHTHQPTLRLSFAKDAILYRALLNTYIEFQMALRASVCALVLILATAFELGLDYRERTPVDPAGPHFRGQMRQFGIKQAEVELHFIWIAGPTRPRPVRQMYFTDYGLDAPQITDAGTLGEIRESGLKDKLETEALAHVKGGMWLDLPELPPFPAAASVSIYDDASRVSNPGMYWRDEPNRTPWQQALFSNDLADVIRMLGSGQLSQKELDEGLFWGCASHRSQLMKLLLKAGANVNAVDEKDGERTTPLLVAVRWHNKEAVETLVRLGSRATARDKYGETELTTLLNDSRDQTEIVRPLLESGVDVNAANIYGLTALMRASRAQPGPVIAMLIKHGANVKAKDYRGDTALSVANENGNGAAAKVLVEAEARR